VIRGGCDCRFFILTPPRSRENALLKKTPKKKKGAPRRGGRRRSGLDSLFANLKGEIDYSWDHSRPEEKRPTPRLLSVRTDRALFNQTAARDYLYLRQLPFACCARVLPLLLPQSVHGRSQNGHGLFMDEYGSPLIFPDARMEDAFAGIGEDVLGLSVAQAKRLRQEILENLESLLSRAIHEGVLNFGDPEDSLANPLGLSILTGKEFEILSFLRGFVLAVRMDNWRNRSLTLKHFEVDLRGEPLTLGGGESLLVSWSRLTASGLTEQIASSEEFDTARLESLRQAGVILPDDYSGNPSPETLYFRRMIGPGVSDDAAMVFVGKTWGETAMYGAFVADAVDTYDKFLERYSSGGSDEALADRLLARLPADKTPLVTETDIRRLIYFAAKWNFPTLDISSSHRRLIQIESGARVPTFLNHLAFVKGAKPARIPLGYNRFDSAKFYRGVTDRALILRLGWELLSPGQQLKTLD